MENKFPQRKHPRLNHYDYSQYGAYFITICTEKRKCLLSCIVGRGLAPAEIQLTKIGEIVEDELLNLEKRYKYLRIDKYVMMPNHLHIIMFLKEKTAGASPRPTITDIVCTFKSLSTIRVKKTNKIDKLFQTSFYEHVIRNDEDYADIKRYIKNNPTQWTLDELYKS